MSHTAAKGREIRRIYILGGKNSGKKFWMSCEYLITHEDFLSLFIKNRIVNGLYCINITLLYAKLFFCGSTPYSFFI